MDHGPKGHRVRDLPVEPDILIGGEEPSEFGADETDDVAQHGHQDESSVEGENKTSPSRCPDGPCQSVKSS